MSSAVKSRSRSPGGARASSGSKKRAPSKEADKCSKSLAKRRQRWAVLFDCLDTSGDALIDKHEFLAAITSWAESCPRIQDDDLDNFAEWDADDNGCLCEGEFFCFCDALWQIIGEREFVALEAKAIADAEVKKAPASGAGPGGAVAEMDPDPSSRPVQLPPAAQEPPEAPRKLISMGTFGHAHTTATCGVASGDVSALAPLVQKAAEKLRDAMEFIRFEPASKEGRKVLRKAINEARSAGVDRLLLDDALQAVRKVEVEEVLRKAMSSGKPKLLKVAILNVSAMGADAAMISEAEALLLQLESREALQIAIKAGDPDAVMAAVALEEAAGLEASEIATARETGHNLKLRTDLDHALAWEQTETKDEFPMIMIIRDLEAKQELGPLSPVEAQILSEAKVGLPNVQKQIQEKASSCQKTKEARTKLMQALAKGTVQDIAAAIDDAQDINLPSEEVERARVVLKKEQTRLELAEAIKNEKRTALVHALDTAKEYDMVMPEIDIAKKLLMQMDVTRDISLAMDKGSELRASDMQALRVIVNDAHDHNVVCEKLAKAEALIAEYGEKHESFKNWMPEH